ncbi:MAG: transglycosylase SLT domain-containing protein [Gemmatimonadetes bacterium]|nr:transglycosylase SLT domain-containing protein [Gemmatimonadota bacterium]
MRYLLILFLFLAVVVAPELLSPRHTPAAPRPPPPAVPPEALRALQEGRYWRASRILREYLAAVPDTTPETLLLAAQAEAGWGEWARVETLLAGRRWLDSVRGGYGWSLLGRGRLERGRWSDSGQALARYLQVAPALGDRERGLVEARRGLAMARARDGRGALRTFDTAARLLPQIGDWIALFAAEAAAQIGDTVEVQRRLGGMDSVVARQWAWRVRVSARRNARDPAGAEREAAAAANLLGTAAARAEAWKTAGELRLLRGDTTAAREALRRAMEAAPEALAAIDAARAMSELPRLNAEDRLRIGRLYLRHGNLDRGMAGLSAYLAAGGGSAVQQAEVRLELGRAMFRAARYADAEKLLLESARGAASARIGAEAMLLAGRSQYRQGRGDAGRATFLRTAELFPQEAPAAKALFLIADLYHDQGELDRAREFYRRTVERNADLNDAGLALMRLGGMAYLEGDHRAAASIFEEYRQRHPSGRRYQPTTYWAGKTYLKLGDTALARQRLRETRALDPFSYYGMQAAELLGESFWNMPIEPSPPTNPTIEAGVARALQRLDLLRELGREDAVSFEIERLKRHFGTRDGALYALAEAFNARGHTFTGIQLGWEVYRREGIWNHRLLRIVYPFVYRNLILAEARERQLDPFLLAGLIRQESMFNAGIASPAGAIGLMQLMPATGRVLARSLGVDGFEPGMLTRPELNVHFGAAYVTELLQRFGNRLPRVLAAYNAGPHRVARWREFPEYQDDELFAERIPFEETRHYVKVVQQNARLYSVLYGDEPVPSSGGD